ncbi:MAG: MBL fold metallo-hydrolase [Planctomycetota bacterium]
MNAQKVLAGWTCAALALLGARGAAQSPNGTTLDVVFFDVGEGDCAVAITPRPDPRVLVIDGGTRRDAADAVGPYLQARGIDAIDLLILSHAGDGHIEGLTELLRTFEVREIWDPGPSAHSTALQAFQSEALAAARTRYYQRFEDQLVEHPTADVDDAVTRRAVLGIPETFGLAELTVLHADDAAPGPQGGEDPRASCLVVRLAFGSQSVLFAADGPGRKPRQLPHDTRAFYTERRLLDLASRDPGLLESTVLKVADHGSTLGCSGAFLDAVRPQWAVISCAADGRNRPHADTLGRLAKRRINVLRTDAADGHARTGDDHVLLAMSAEGLTLRQLDTNALLDAATAASATPQQEPRPSRPRQLIRPRPLRGGR